MDSHLSRYVSWWRSLLSERCVRYGTVFPVISCKMASSAFVVRRALPQGFCYRTEVIASRKMLPKSGYCLTMGVTQTTEARTWMERSAE